MTERSYAQTSGWVIFAATMFVLVGVFNVIWGLTAIINAEWIVLADGKFWYLDLTAWGWITLIVGVIQFLVAWGVLSGQTWAKIVGIIAAGIAALNAFFVIPYYAIWGILILALAVMIIYGLAVHGDEVAEA